MLALLDQQHVIRRPEATPRERFQNLYPFPSQGRWRRESERPRDRRRIEARPTRRSDRLDALIRGQRVRVVSRPAARRVERARREPQARIRVERPGTLRIGVTAFVMEAREYVLANWRILSSVTAAAFAVLACVVAFSRLPAAQRVPAITLEGDSTVESLLLDERLPESSASAGTLAPAVVKILQEREHVVRSGETLSEIATRYRLRLGTLINYNGITDVRTVPAGKRLKIPNGDGLLHVVRRGDSIGKVASLYGVSLNAIRDWNDLQTDTIRTGQRLFVPGASMAEDDINRVLGKLFIYPTRGELTSAFGYRFSPIVKQVLFHYGIDIHSRTGTPVYASRAGVVASVEIGPVYGKTVLLSHSGGYQSMYAHLDTILVRRGQSVSQGAQIGSMGTTGSTTGPHLHFSILKNREPIDPLKLLH